MKDEIFSPDCVLPLLHNDELARHRPGVAVQTLDGGRGRPRGVAVAALRKIKFGIQFELVFC